MRITNFLSNATSNACSKATAPDVWQNCVELRADGSMDGDGTTPIDLIGRIPIGSPAPYGGQVSNEGCCYLNLFVSYLDDNAGCGVCAESGDQTVTVLQIKVRPNVVMELPAGYISHILMETTDVNCVNKAVPSDQKITYQACNTPDVLVETDGDVTFVTVEKSAVPDPVEVGQTATYTVVVTNLGPVDATGSSLTDTLPAEVTYNPGTITGLGADDSGAPTLVWNFGVMTVGQVETVTYDVTANTAGTAINTALFASPDCA